MNVRGILETGYPFIFMWGGRGTGKTYGILKHTIDSEKKFVLLRSRRTQVDMLRIPQFNPFKQINADTGLNIQPAPIGKEFSAFYHMKWDENKEVKASDEIGYISALSTIGSLRGFGSADIELLFYDEFIPEKSEQPVKNAGFALMNGYETINRNRELKGEKPLQMICASNSENIACPVFAELGLIKKASEMNEKRQEICFLRDRGILLINLCNSPISRQKADTALYRMVGKGSDFYNMSINNDFYSADYSSIEYRPLTEYTPLVSVGEITIYEHKSKDELYVTKKKSGTPIDIYSNTERHRAAFRRKYIWIWNMYLEDLVKFSDMESKILLDFYFGK